MKLTVEIDDALQHAVNTQIAKAIATIGENTIKVKVDEIIGKKVARLDVTVIVEKLVTKRLNQKIDEQINALFDSNPYATKIDQLRKFFLDAATKLLKSI